MPLPANGAGSVAQPVRAGAAAGGGAAAVGATAVGTTAVGGGDAAGGAGSLPHAARAQRVTGTTSWRISLVARRPPRL